MRAFVLRIAEHLSIPMWGNGARDPVEVCRPIGIDVWKVDDDLLTGWAQPGFPEYAGGHGLSDCTWG